MRIKELQQMKKCLESAIKREAELLEVDIKNDKDYIEISKEIKDYINHDDIQISFYCHALEFSIKIYEDGWQYYILGVDTDGKLHFGDQYKIEYKDDEKLKELANRFKMIVQKFY